ncbi:MAG TPA: hypothetical protein VF756_16795 [Thermoanaerobaculia bacterium]
MFRSMSRLVVAAAVVLALMAFTVPAQAQSFTIEVSALDLSDSWFGAALAWLHGLLAEDTGAERPMQSAVAASRGGSDSDSTVTPMTGSCIDPQGGGKWCGI